MAEVRSGSRFRHGHAAICEQARWLAASHVAGSRLRLPEFASAHDRSEIPPASPARPAGGSAPRCARADRAAGPWSRRGLRRLTAACTAGGRGRAHRSGEAPARERACVTRNEARHVLRDVCSSTFHVTDSRGASLDRHAGACFHPACCDPGPHAHICCCGIRPRDRTCCTCCCNARCACCCALRSRAGRHDTSCSCDSCRCVCCRPCCSDAGRICCHHAPCRCVHCRRSDGCNTSRRTCRIVATRATRPGADGPRLHRPQPGR